MSVVLTLPIGALANVSEPLPVGIVNRGHDLPPHTPKGTPKVNKTPNGGKTPNEGRTPNGSSTPNGGRTPGSRRARRAHKVKTWTPDSSIPSRGSKNHFEGKCRPCYAFNTPEGCPNGAMCNFCHFPHDDVDSEESSCACGVHAKKNARRLSFSLQEEVMEIGYDCEVSGKRPQGNALLGMQNWPMCEPCEPMNPTKRRNTAPAIFTFDIALPFLAPDATPDLCKRVLSSVDSRLVEEMLMQNMPEQYED